MKSDTYDVANVPAPALAREAEEAAVALARFDERLRRAEPALAEGFRARAHLFEAQALVALSGGVAPLEALVLHDADMPAQAATVDIVRAGGTLALRRSMAARDANEALRPEAVARLLGLAAPDARPVAASAAAWDHDDEDQDEFETDAGDEPDPAFAEVDALLARAGRALGAYNDRSGPLRLIDPEHDEAGRLARWLACLDATERHPAALAVALALDAWLWLEPSSRRGEIGFMLAANVARARGLSLHHLPALAHGLRRGRFRWRRTLDPPTRLKGLLAAIGEAARHGHADLDRLTLAYAGMLRRCEGKSKNSRLRGLVDLFVSAPLVTIATASEALRITPQGIEAMMAELGPALPRELTERKRYRAWGIF